MLVKVTQKHLDEGEPCSCANCPVSLAIKEAFVKEKLLGCRVSSTHVAAFFNKQTVCSQLPQEVTHFVLKFDLKEKVEPFEFELVLEKK